MKKPLLRSLVCLAVAMGSGITVHAADWPDRPITIIVPAAAGGSPDIISRLLGNALAQRLGQPVVVDNKPGAGGNIGMQALAKSAPDGYTMAYGNNATLATNQFLFKSIPYQPEQLVPVVALVSTHSLLVVSPKLPVNSVQELVDYAKQNPGKLSFASGGNGTSGHLGAEMFKLQSGMDALHVPYRGAPQAINDVAAGNADLLIDNIASVGPMAQSQRVKALAVTAKTRLPQFPDLPSVAEAGLPNFEVRAWGGFVMPAGVPAQAVQRINQEMNAVLADPQIKEQLDKMAFKPLGGEPAAFAGLLSSERGIWKGIVQASGAKVE